jgi:hypothetical protein
VGSRADQDAGGEEKIFCLLESNPSSSVGPSHRLVTIQLSCPSSSEKGKKKQLMASSCVADDGFCLNSHNNCDTFISNVY